MLNGVIQRNAYNKDMSRMIYVKSDYHSSDGISSGKGQYDHFKMKSNNINEDGTPSSDVIPDDKVAAAEME